MTDYPIIVLPGFSYFRVRLLRLLFYSYHPVSYARSRLSYIDDVYDDMYLLKLMTLLYVHIITEI